MSVDISTYPLDRQIQFIVERRFLQRVLELSRQGVIDEVRMRQIARLMQAMRPWKSWDEALIKVRFLSEKYPEFAPLTEFVVMTHEEMHNKELIDRMHAHLQRDEIDQALAVAKQT